MRRLLPLFAGSMLLLSACASDDMSTPITPADAEAASTAPEAPTALAAAPVPDGAVVLARFEAVANPATGTLEFTRVVESTEGRHLRTTGQAIWCEATVDSDGVAGSGADDTIELFTVDGSIHAALSTDLAGQNACRDADLNAEDARYDDLFPIDGVFCADVGIRSFYGTTLGDVHVALVYTGEAEHAPYQHPYGTGADASALRGAGADAPTASDGGLLEYGDLAPDTPVTVRWMFKNGNDAPFQFTGSVYMTVEEDCDNGIDDDCDGIIDNACREFADGSDCVEAADCASGVCTDGTCRAASCADGVENGDEEGVDCGGSCGAGCSGCSDMAIWEFEISDRLWLCAFNHEPNKTWEQTWGVCDEAAGYHLATVGPMTHRGLPTDAEINAAMAAASARGHDYVTTGHPARSCDWTGTDYEVCNGLGYIHTGERSRFGSNWRALTDGNTAGRRSWPSANRVSVPYHRLASVCMNASDDPLATVFDHRWR